VKFSKPYERSHDFIENKVRRFSYPTMLLKTSNLSIFATMSLKTHELTRIQEFETISSGQSGTNIWVPNSG